MWLQASLAAGASTQLHVYIMPESIMHASETVNKMFNLAGMPLTS